MKPQNKQQTGGYGGCLLLVLIAILIFACSCTKEETLRLNTYTMIIDHHSLDTTRLYSRYKQDLGILIPSEAIKIDTAHELWYINCATMDTLEHLYYLRNNIKIQK